jgi:hypothetical protein
MNAANSPSELLIDPPHVEAVGHFTHPALDGYPITTLANGRVVGEFYNAKLASVLADHSRGQQIRFWPPRLFARGIEQW